MTNLLLNQSGSSPILKKPTRDELIHIKSPLQGLMVETEFGLLPWFEPAVGWIKNRQDVYAKKIARGDTHVNVTLSGSYHESGQPYNNIPGQDYSQRLDELVSLLKEIISAGTHLDSGFKILLTLAGDGMSRSDRSYNDPAGMTYGFEWLMENIERIRKSLDEVSPWIVWNPGYDGIVPAWQPWSCVDNWILKFRSIDSSSVLALELGAGYWAWSGETDDYNNRLAGKQLDVVLFEGPVPFGLPPFPTEKDFSKAPWDPMYNQVLQIAKRQLGPRYIRPANLPPDYDPGQYNSGPLSSPAVNGNRAVIGYEPNTYTFVRDGNVNRANTEIAFLRSLGYE